MNNKNFVYKKYGDKKKVLIILPGWGETRKTFDFYIQNLKDKFTIYIFDYPGFGESVFPDKDLTINDYALYIKRFMEENNISNPYILCHSFGCRIIILLTGKYRVLIDRLIIIGGAGIRRKSIKRYLRTKKYKILKKISYLLPKSKRESYLNKLRDKYSSTDYKDLDNHIRNTFINVINTDLRKYLKYIYLPTLLIWGELDESTPIKDAKLMNKKINNSGLITLKKGTHFVYLEYPFYILNIIKNFFI